MVAINNTPLMSTDELKCFSGDISTYFNIFQLLYTQAVVNRQAPSLQRRDNDKSVNDCLAGVLSSC